MRRRACRIPDGPAVIGDVVPVVAPRRGIEWQQPDRGHAQFGDVVELLESALEVAYAIVVRIEERFDVKLVDDRVLVPERVLRSALAGWLVHAFSVVDHGAGRARQMA